MMKLNSVKSKYVLHKGMLEDFATRLTLDGCHIGRQKVTKILGLWIGEEPSSWEYNTKEIIKRTVHIDKT